MSGRTTKVNVNNAVMKWARETAGLKLQDVSKILNISVSTIEEWEQEKGAKKPTINTLRKLAAVYKRPLAAFFLPEPPQEPPMPTDFRTLPDEQRTPLSKKTLLAIRKARYVQSIATELLEAEGTLKDVIERIGRISARDDPELAANRERQRLGITIEDQAHFRSPHEAFRKWREVLENLNIVVYQTRVPPEEIRGFSLLEEMAPIITVSFSDSIHAKMFTLFHEYAHILLNTSGICIPQEASTKESDIDLEIERFCNHFAGAFLVPRYSLNMDQDVALIARQSTIPNPNLNRIATRFRVSTQVVLRRLLISGFISRDRYLYKLQELLSQQKPRHKGEFKMPASRRCIVENGRLFVSLAFDAMAREKITYSDVADYLSIDLKNLDRVKALI